MTLAGIIAIASLLVLGCVSAAVNLSNGKKKTELPKVCGKPLKYPVVMVHGIARNDRGRIFDSWGRIPSVLEANGVEVFYGNTDAWGGIESNAELLKNTIDEILSGTENKKVNIIAHSKGGIDSRYCIWKYGYGDKVASLTTIATPHHGSIVADYIFDIDQIHSGRIKRRLTAIEKLYGDVNPDIYNVNYQLTTGKMKEFNERTGADKRVYYQSLYSTMNDPSDDAFFSISYNYIKKFVGDNDGLVSEYSACWGENSRKIGNGISHEQIIDHHRRRKTAAMNIPGIYLDIVNDLGNKGF